MKIICIGRNYADHARELGNQVPSEPVVFLKPQSAILSHKHPFYIPDWTQEVHHEVELVVKLNRERNISVKVSYPCRILCQQCFVATICGIDVV